MVSGNPGISHQYAPLIGNAGTRPTDTNAVFDRQHLNLLVFIHIL
jgi:hypothetical protein